MRKIWLPKHNKRCVVIGTTRLCVYILEQLASREWDILDVVSDDETVCQYCVNNKLKLSSELNGISSKDFILFSVANYSILSNTFLEDKKVILAINYHDSLLPKYAGLNSTTWAVANGELQHGVSWHLISPTIDGGEILRQSSFEISSNETAFSLNVKCFEEASKLFIPILEDLESGSIEVRDQDITQKTYYSRNKVFANYGFIDFRDDFEKINRAYRALYFGDKNYTNPVTSVKIWDGEKAYLVGNIEFIPQVNAVPGYVYAAFGSDLSIGIKGGKLSIKNLMTIDGRPISIERTNFGLDTIINPLILEDTDIEIISKTRSEELKILKMLKGNKWRTDSFFESESLKNDNHKFHFSMPIDTIDFETIFCKTTFTLLKFINNDLCVPIINCRSFTSTVINELVKNQSYITLTLDQKHSSYCKFSEFILNQCLKKYLIPKDFSHRYDLDPACDVGIFLSKDYPISETDHTGVHRIAITITDTHLHINGYQQDRILLDSFCSSLRYFINGVDEQQNDPCLRNFAAIPLNVYDKQDYSNSPTNEDFILLFEERAQTTPDAVAVVFEGQEINYATLNRSANQFARHLKKLGAKKETIIGVGLERSAELIICLLGILKAGSAYLPLDPFLPQERLQFILDDSGAEILITHSFQEVFKKFHGKKVLLDRDFTEISKNDSNSPLNQCGDPDRLAYVLYTSGSTGKPKGVEIVRRSLNNLIEATQQKLKFSNSDRWLILTTISFDISILELLLPLRQGGTIVLGKHEISRDPYALAKTLKENEITFVQATPATWQMLVDSNWQGDPKLTILSGGEALPRKLANRLTQIIFTLWNGYGPTETTIYSAMKKIEPFSEIITIGTPIANTNFYILDSKMNFLPTGVIGELYIGGAGVGRGYRNRPELTKEKFISTPFGRLYKTGDRARYLPNGEIDFLGRIDTQVKIRGYRIELGEIEELLSKCSNVKQAVVIAREEKPGDTRIIAYYRGNADQKEINAKLVSQLPSYMIPSAYVQVAEFQLNPNGKIDRKALPTPSYEFDKKTYIPPSNPIESEVVKIFETILDTANVGIQDNFFALGGHSLLAARAITKLNQIFQINLPLKTLFERPTAVLLEKEIKSSLLTHKKDDRIPKTKEAISCGISSAQQGFWFLSHQMPKSSLYNIPFFLEFNGNLDVHALEQSLRIIVDRHEILRTVFLEEAEQVESVVLNYIETPFKYEDLRNAVNPQIESDQVIALEANKPFDLSQGPLFRFLLLRTSKFKYRLFLNFHHMVFDGHSVNLLIHELKVLYEACKNGLPNPLEALPIQYSDYTNWKSKQPLKKEEISWWRKKLQDAPPLLNLPIDMHRPHIQTYKGSIFEFPIVDMDQIQSFKQFAQKHESTLFSVFLSVFYVLLLRYTRQNDFVIGVPVLGRSHRDLESLMGCFVHTLPFRMCFNGEISFSELIRSIRNDWLEAFENQDVPFEKIVDELRINRSLDHSPVFQTMFNMLPKIDIERIDNLHVQLNHVDREMAHFDLSLSIQETSEGIRGIFEYNTDLFFMKTIERMGIHFQNLIKAILANADIAINKIEMLDESEIHKMMVEWNKQMIPYFKNATILELIERSAEKNPDSLAVICGSKSYTYSQLILESNRVAHVLLSRGIKKEDKIAVCLERSAAFIPAILGILKAGGAYVPLDPLEPRERMEAKLNELLPLCVLTQKSLEDRFPKPVVICIDDLPPASVQNPKIPTSNDQLAYMIYTSGTTGHPKGVEVEHKSINDRVLWKQGAYPMSSDDVMLHTYSFIFDGSIINYFWPLCAGSRLVIATKEEQFDSAALIELIQNQEVTTVDLLPSLLQGILDEKEFSFCSTLKNVFSGGEALPMDLVRSFFAKSSAKLHNTYGPTEATVEASAWECDPEYKGTIAPIGTPIAGAKFYILDSSGNILPEGVPGELCIGGVGLARGYFNDPISTREKFVSNPFIGERLYRTGDLAKYLSDGTVEFLGRIDSHQVKIRGYRIDLREIESALMRMDPVEKAIVLVKGDSAHKRLVAYVKVSPRMDEKILYELMKHFLNEYLPPYMIPQQLCIIDQVPVLLNGKIDVKGLPEPMAMDKTDTIKKKSKSKLEQQLTRVWREVLDLSSIDSEDNFFEIGGNSLLAMRLMVRIRNQLGLSIPLVQFFQHPTIKALAQSIKDRKYEKPWSPLVPMQTQGDKEPFFCVHPVGGGVMCYNSLVKYWGKDRPFYALQARGMEEGQLPYDSIQIMADEYIKAMRQVQKTGPYFLGGWSFGGLVAAEIVKKLRQKGEKVSRLVLIDTTANIKKFQKIDLGDESLILSELTQHFRAKPNTKSKLSLKEQFARFIDNGGKRALHKAKKFQTVDRLVNVAKANYSALKNFFIPALDVDVILLKSEANPETDLGWKRYAKNIMILSVPGDHWAITQEHKAHKYAQIVQQCLEIDLAENRESIYPTAVAGQQL